PPKLRLDGDSVAAGADEPGVWAGGVVLPPQDAATREAMRSNFELRTSNLELRSAPVRHVKAQATMAAARNPSSETDPGISAVERRRRRTAASAGPAQAIQPAPDRVGKTKGNCG